MNSFIAHEYASDFWEISERQMFNETKNICGFHQQLPLLKGKCQYKEVQNQSLQIEFNL